MITSTIASNPSSLTPSVVISVIALITSILSPILTAFVNRKFELEKQKIEVFERRRLDVLENYFLSASDSIAHLGFTPEFAKYKNMIFLYAPSDIHDKINRLHEIIYDADINNEISKEATDLLSEIAIACPFMPVKKRNILLRVLFR